MGDKLSELGLPRQIAHDSEQYVFVLRAMADGAQKTAIQECYMHGFHSVFIFVTAIAGSALVASLVIRKFSMDKILLTAYSVK